MLFVVVFILILGFLVVAHEFGHFLVAKKSGIGVEEFGLGFPPRIWGKKKGETTYSINAIPLGGFVKLFDEEGVEEKEKLNLRSFYGKPAATKIGVIAAGAIANFIIAVIIFYFLLIQTGFSFNLGSLPDRDYRFPFGRQDNLVAISAVLEGSPAQQAGIESNSLIISVNQERFEDIESFINFIDNNRGKKINLQLKSLINEEEKIIEVVPRENPPKEEGALGVGLAKIVQLKYTSPAEKIASGFLHSFNMAHLTLSSLGYLVGESVKERELDPLTSSLVGPVGILFFTKITVEAGIIEVLSLMASISLALGIINFFPLPALDGGKILFIAVETLTGKKIPPRLERNINLAGFVFLIGLMILIIYKDIIQYGPLILK